MRGARVQQGTADRDRRRCLAFGDGPTAVAQTLLAAPRAGVPGRIVDQQHPALRARTIMTERARADACHRIGKNAQPVAVVAADTAVGWHPIHAIGHQPRRQAGQRPPFVSVMSARWGSMMHPCWGLVRGDGRSS